MTGEKHQNWEKSWLEGNLSSEELREISAKDSQFKSLETFVNSASNLQVPNGISKKDAWKKLESKISTTSSPKVIPITRRNWVVGIAASFILAVGAFFILNQNANQTTVATSLAEVLSIDLPDGSVVHLNAESSVSFPEKGWNDEREIELVGEAFFEVKSGSSFTVKTSNGSVQVLGTSFNVRSRRDLMQVACKTGKVLVTSGNGNSDQIITPGLTVKVENNLVSVPIEMRLDRIDSWRKGQYDYESTPLQQVLNEVKRLYKVEIEHDFSESELTSPITTTFKGLKDAAQTIAVQKGRGFEVIEEDDLILFKVK